MKKQTVAGSEIKLKPLIKDKDSKDKDKDKDKVPTRKVKAISHKEKDTSLLKSALKGIKEGVKKGGDLNARDERTGDTPLIIACENGHLDFVRELLRLGVSLNLADCEGRTALHKTVLKGNTDILRALLMQSALDPNIQDNNGHSPLVLAIHNNQLLVIDQLLERDGLSTDVEDPSGQQPIHHACKASSFKAIRSLAKNNVDINSKNREGLAPIHIASMQNHSASLTVVMGSGADFLLKNKEGKYASDLATEQTLIQVLESKIKESMNSHLHKLPHPLPPPPPPPTDDELAEFEALITNMASDSTNPEIDVFELLTPSDSSYPSNLVLKNYLPSKMLEEIVAEPPVMLSPRSFALAHNATSAISRSISSRALLTVSKQDSPMVEEKKSAMQMMKQSPGSRIGRSSISKGAN
eukprot:TRINITY_DN8335_c0_g1_i1.p1 TRINITY_DN8335_c0_g1~~TRINITY_DN8335_c0_g1_i1.p1  ORF type:complete len:411 (-),score=125.38 TRINITY_DN8335_c0_g1_i1:72-1304(-)